MGSALTLAALLLVTAGVLIGTNLGSGDGAQPAPATADQEVQEQWSHSVDPSLGIMGWELNSASRSTMSVATGNAPPLATLRLQLP